MAIWDKLKTELDRAGKAAQNALDEGKVRLEAFRTDLDLKSSGGDPRVLMERLVVELCRR